MIKMHGPLSDNTYINPNLQWSSSAEHNVMQSNPAVVGLNVAQNAHLATLGWGYEKVFPQDEMEHPIRRADDVNLQCNLKRVKRKLLAADGSTVTLKMEPGEESGLAQTLDDCLFPEIGNSGDALLRYPSNVDYLLGCVTPRKQSWDPEDVLKSHGIDIFGNNGDREEFTNFCKTLIAEPSGGAGYNKSNMPSVGYDKSPLWSCKGTQVTWSNCLHHQTANMENRRYRPSVSQIYPAASVDNQMGNSFHSNRQQPPSKVPPSPSISPHSDFGRSQEQVVVDSLRYMKRRRRRRTLGLTVCDALYFDGQKYVNIKVISDGTRKYRLVLPKEHKHIKGMPEEVPIFTVSTEG